MLFLKSDIIINNNYNYMLGLNNLFVAEKVNREEKKEPGANNKIIKKEDRSTEKIKTFINSDGQIFKGTDQFNEELENNLLAGKRINLRGPIINLESWVLSFEEKLGYLQEAATDGHFFDLKDVDQGIVELEEKKRSVLKKIEDLTTERLEYIRGEADEITKEYIDYLESGLKKCQALSVQMESLSEEIENYRSQAFLYFMKKGDEYKDENEGNYDEDNPIA